MHYFSYLALVAAIQFAPATDMIAGLEGHRLRVDSFESSGFQLVAQQGFVYPPPASPPNPFSTSPSYSSPSSSRYDEGPRGRVAGAAETSDDIFGSDGPEREPRDDGLGPAEDEPALSAEDRAAGEQLRRLIGEQPVRRRPADILGGYSLDQKARASEESPAPSAPDPDAHEKQPKDEALASRLLLGDWTAIEKQLAALPGEQQSLAYSGLLGLLVDDGWGFFLPEEVLALANVAPLPLDERQATALGQLLRRSLQHAETPGAFLGGLGQARRLGTGDDQRQGATVRLLMAAELLAEAERFLPPLESPQVRSNAALLNLHADFNAALAQDGKQEAIAKAWQLSEAVLALADSPGEERKAAIARALVLVPRVAPETASKWMASMLRTDDDAEVFKLLGTIAARSPAAFRRFSPEGRVDALRLASVAGEQLLAVRGERLAPDTLTEDTANRDARRWSLALATLAHGWVNEAQKSLGGEFRRIAIEDDDKYPNIPIEQLLTLAPDPAWRTAIDRDMADHISHLFGELAARAGNREAALATIRELAPKHPHIAKQIAQSVLVPETEDSDRDFDFNDRFSSHRYSSSGAVGNSHWVSPRAYSHSVRSSGPPTRGRQVQKLAELEANLADFKQAGVPPLADEVLLAAFAQCHSPAEVFRKEDLARVFGSLDALSPTAAQAVVDAMRENLASMWRDPQVQQQSGTKRTPKDMVEEINRGYQLAAGIAKQVAAKTNDVSLRTAQASALFDHAEFLYGQQVDLKSYVRLRDAAFAAFGQAAETYAASMDSAAQPTADSVAVYQSWFQAALGASDLAYLSKQDEPDKTQVQMIAAALQSLPKEAADTHRTMFAAGIDAALSQTPPPLKPHVVRQALAILGNHPEAKQLAERLAYYDELLGEVELVAAIDGSDRVGAKEPFGVHLAIRGTRPVFRENDLFAALVAPPASAAETEPRRALEREIREKLGERFDIEALAFHTHTARPRTIAREGWQERPLAYAVLRAKDESVDRLPPMQVDLDFADGQQPVRLPVRTSVVLIDARSAPTARPVRELRLRQTLDDRQLDEGRVSLEVIAAGRGIPPKLEGLIEDPQHVEGFGPGEVHDHGLSIVSLSAEDHVEPEIERRWTIEYALSSGNRPEAFRFPAARDTAIAQQLQRYADADIVDSGPSSELGYGALSTAGELLWLFVAIGLVLAIGGAAYFLLRKRKREHVETTAYHWPERLNAFNTLAILERMRGDAALRMNASERRELEETIAAIELRFFAQAASTPTDLETLRSRWHPYTAAANGHTKA